MNDSLSSRDIILCLDEIVMSEDTSKLV